MDPLAGQSQLSGDGAGRQAGAIQRDSLFLLLDRPPGASGQGRELRRSSVGDAGACKGDADSGRRDALLAGDLQHTLGGILGSQPARVSEVRGDGRVERRAGARVGNSVFLQNSADLLPGEFFSGGDLRDGAAGLEGGQDALGAQQGAGVWWHGGIIRGSGRRVKAVRCASRRCGQLAACHEWGGCARISGITGWGPMRE